MGIMTQAGPALVGENGDAGGAREQLLEAASQIMREGDTIDLSLSELSLRAGLNSARQILFRQQKWPDAGVA
jgi:hypothetical protein